MLLRWLLLEMAAPWISASWDGCSLGWLLLAIAAPWMAASDPCCFVDFEQVKNLIVILLTLNKFKKLTKKLPWEKLDAYASFFGHGLMSPALHPGFSDL